jgi:hypothetical protein
MKKNNVLLTIFLAFIFLLHSIVFFIHAQYRLTELTSDPQIFMSFVDKQSKIGLPVTLQNKDRLISIDGRSFENSGDVLTYFATRAGEDIQIHFERENQELSTSVSIPETYPTEKVGIAFRTHKVDPNIMVSMSAKVLVFGPIGSLIVLFLEWIALGFVLLLSFKKSKWLYRALGLYVLYFVVWWIYVLVFIDRI